jgi:hypothetical protein
MTSATIPQEALQEVVMMSSATNFTASTETETQEQPVAENQNDETTTVEDTGEKNVSDSVENVVDEVKEITDSENTNTNEEDSVVKTTNPENQENLLAALKQLIDAGLSTVTEAVKGLSETVEKQSERVSALETVQQTRKSVAVGDVLEGDTSTQDKKPTIKHFDDPLNRNLLGLSRKRNA